MSLLLRKQVKIKKKKTFVKKYIRTDRDSCKDDDLSNHETTG